MCPLKFHLLVISYPYIEECVFHLAVKGYDVIDLRAHKPRCHTDRYHMEFYYSDEDNELYIDMILKKIVGSVIK